MVPRISLSIMLYSKTCPSGTGYVLQMSCPTSSTLHSLVDAGVFYVPVFFLYEDIQLLPQDVALSELFPGQDEVVLKALMPTV